MGIFEDYKDTKRNAEYVAADAKTAAIKKVMGDLGDTLAKPVFEGDLDTALVHFMREEAFENDELIDRYKSLARRIEKEQKDAPIYVPMLVLHRPDHDAFDMVPRQTTFVQLPREGGAIFRSEEEYEKDVTMHAFAGQRVKNEETGDTKWQPETAGVTHKLLSIPGITFNFTGDLLRGQHLSRKGKCEEKFVLSESHIADDGHGANRMSDYAYNDFRYDKLAERNDFEVHGENGALVIVGWDAIDQAIADQVISHSNGDLEEAAKKLEKFLEGVGLPPVPNVDSPLPLTDEFVKKYQELKQVATS